MISFALLGQFEGMENASAVCAEFGQSWTVDMIAAFLTPSGWADDATECAKSIARERAMSDADRADFTREYARAASRVVAAWQAARE